MENKYKNMTNEEINDKLLKIPQKEWHKHESLIKEGLSRWLELAGFNKEIKK